MSSEPTKGRKPSWGGRTLLIVSLAANLFLAGVIAGNFQRGPWKGVYREGPVPFMTFNSPMDFRRVVSDPEVGEKLKETLDELRPQMRSSMRNTVEARRSIFTAIGAEPFDQEALTEAFENARLADDAMRRLAQSGIESFILSLTPEQRKEIVAAVEEMPVRRRGPGGPGGPMFGPEFDGPNGDRPFRSRITDRPGKDGAQRNTFDE